jgi:uncharacterized damage-inducible protein DinB
MTVTDLKRLYDYGYWANGKLFAAMAQLAPQQFTEAVAGSHGSIRNTMVHVMSAEWGWLSRCGGAERGPALKPEAYPTLEVLVDAWARVEGYVREFLSNLEDEELVRTVEFPNPLGEKRSMAVGELLQHAANHGVHHRGQVALLLRLLGHSPGNFDMLIHDAERHGMAGF